MSGSGSVNLPFLGIDFGTSMSTMAWFSPRSGQAELIPNAEGELKTPSLVYFGQDELLVGTPAEQMLDDEELRGRVIASVKRDLGRPLCYPIPGVLPDPARVTTEILAKLKRDAEEGHFHVPVTRAVITFPASFARGEREKLLLAARRAGFSEARLLEEPVAAAMAYARAGQNVGRHVLVYDLGAGTFDLALLTHEDVDEGGASDGAGSYRLALPPKGMPRGGDDFDRKLYFYCDEVARRELGRPISLTEEINLRFLFECRKRKELLSGARSSRLIALLPDTEKGAVQFKHELHREQFEALILEELRETVALTAALFEEAHANSYPVESVVLIGGSSRLPLVTRLLEERLGAQCRKFDRTDYAVALGAAFYAQDLWGEPATPTVQVSVSDALLVVPEPPGAEKPPSEVDGKAKRPDQSVGEASGPDAGSDPSLPIAVYAVGGATQHFAFIDEAVRAAPAGATVRIPPGTYPASFPIGKPLSLVGIGRPGEVELVSSPTRWCIEAKGDQIRLYNLTLLGLHDQVVLVRSGDLTLQDCHVRCAGPTTRGVDLSPGSRAALLGCRIDVAAPLKPGLGRTYQLGVYRAEAQLEDCTIDGGKFGIHAIAGVLRLTRCQFTGYSEAGLRLEDFEDAGKHADWPNADWQFSDASVDQCKFEGAGAHVLIDLRSKVEGYPDDFGELRRSLLAKEWDAADVSSQRLIGSSLGMTGRVEPGLPPPSLPGGRLVDVLRAKNLVTGMGASSIMAADEFRARGLAEAMAGGKRPFIDSLETARRVPGGLLRHLSRLWDQAGQPIRTRVWVTRPGYFASNVPTPVMGEFFGAWTTAKTCLLQRLEELGL